MTKYALNRNAGSFGPVKLLENATSSGTLGTAELPTAMSNWTLQVVAASTDAQVLLRGSLSTTAADHITTLLTFSSTDPTGTLISVTGKPASQLSAILDAGASSAGINAWIAGTP